MTSNTSDSSSTQRAVLLVNLGTPDAPTPPAVRRFLREFLSDPRVIEIPRLIWAIILNLFVLPFRPKRVAHAYASIWAMGDSPMRLILNAQANALQQMLDFQIVHRDVAVLPAMTYGTPSLAATLDRLSADGVEQIIILPLFPQYSATSTGAVYDVATRWMQTQRNLPTITFIKDYFAHPLYIQALADSVHRYQVEHGVPDRLLMSFHGIPIPYAERGDPYPKRCHATAKHVAEALGLRDDQWAISFQSRFGKQEWVKPYTNVLLTEWAQAGVKSVQIISPAFSADCLETLEELAIENRDVFLNAGGASYQYIPALNADVAHIEMMAALINPILDGFEAIS
ncbi:ferrochelatase [Aquirhabdus sp.]|uniref:ferrochelatase n=1 Tax=Aquirhabdus sp. TaxID=2824160 RepID=UPI00396CE131